MGAKLSLADMTMVVIARLLDLPQAQVAASALRSAGLHPVLFEEHQNYANWTYMLAIGGCRLAVPGDEAQDALAILEHPPEAAETPDADQIGWPWRMVAGFFGVGLLWPVLGWAIVGARSRRLDMAHIVLSVALVGLTVGLALAATMEAAHILGLLLFPNTPRCVGCT